MGILRLAGTLAAAAVAFSGYAAYRRRRGPTGVGGEPRTAEPLQRWEGEGGAVPAVKRRRPADAARSEDRPDTGAAAAAASPTADAPH